MQMRWPSPVLQTPAAGWEIGMHKVILLHNVVVFKTARAHDDALRRLYVHLGTLVFIDTANNNLAQRVLNKGDKTGSRLLGDEVRILLGNQIIVLKTQSGHYGFGDLSSPALTILAQLIDILFMGFLYWWLFVRKNGVEFNWLWRYAYVGLAAALLLIARLGISQPVQIFTSAAFEIALVFLWLALTDIARNSKFHPHAVFGFGYLLYTVPDWVARGMASTFAISSIDETAVSLCLFAIVLVVAFLLPHRAPGVQLLLADFTSNPPQDSHDAICERCEKLATQNGLSARETEVVYHLCYGRSKQYIAETLYLSENTIRTYTQRVYRKLGIHHREELQRMLGI